MDILQHVHAGGEHPANPYRAQPAWSEEEARLARRLGWFSLAVGALELSAPEAIAGWLGVPDRQRFVRAMGARGVANGIGLLSQRRPVGWVWSRVVGDAMDLAMLATSLPALDRRRRVAATAGLLAGFMAIDLLCAERLRRSGAPS